jgi:hypothetical protein
LTDPVNYQLYMRRPILPPPVFFKGTVFQWNSLTTSQRGSAKHRATHKEELQLKNKAYNATHKDEMKVKKKAYRVKNFEKLNAKVKATNKTVEGKKKKAAHDKKSRVKNKERIKVRGKAYYQKNKEKILAQKRAELCKDGRDWLVANGGVLTEDSIE